MKIGQAIEALERGCIVKNCFKSTYCIINGEINKLVNIGDSQIMNLPIYNLSMQEILTDSWKIVSSKEKSITHWLKTDGLEK